MADERPLSRFAQRFVARKLEQLTKQASKGTGLYYELFAQNFTDSVDRLAERSKRSDLRNHIVSEAEKGGNYAREEKGKGRWDYDQEQGELIWKGEPLDWMKKVDFEGQWVRKSPDERARYIVGYYGEDSRTQNDYPGIQVEKNNVAGPVNWGPGQPTGQDAQLYAEKMLDGHLGFAAPKIEPSSLSDIRKADAMSERLGAKVLTKPYRKYMKDSAAPRNSAAQKYGPDESTKIETPAQKRSR